MYSNDNILLDFSDCLFRRHWVDLKSTKNRIMQIVWNYIRNWFIRKPVKKRGKLFPHTLISNTFPANWYCLLIRLIWPASLSIK